MQVIRRKDAMASGLVRYFTGKPCPAGHLSERFVSTGTCRTCLREKTKSWQAIERNKMLNRAYARDWALSNPERAAQNKRAWRLINLQALTAREAERSKRPDRQVERRLSEARRRAMKHHSRGTHTRAEVLALLEKQCGKCPYCAASIRGKYHIDHVLPLSRGGTNAIENIQLLCPPCNHRKYTKHPLIFARELGLLL